MFNFFGQSCCASNNKTLNKFVDFGLEKREQQQLVTAKMAINILKKLVDKSFGFFLASIALLTISSYCLAMCTFQIYICVLFTPSPL